MIDIHNHILPGIDDGASNYQMALELIRMAYENGTTDLILTPHCAPSYGFFNFNGPELAFHFNRLCQRIYEQEQLEIQLHPGMEVLFEGRKKMLQNLEQLFPLCGGIYLLMEYYFDVDAVRFVEGIETVQECGYLPIIAHPERYRCIQEQPGLLLEGYQRGAYFQLNKGSLSGRHGKQAYLTACRIMDADLADFIASDAHHPKYRNSNLGKIAQFIAEQYGEERAVRLFQTNAQCVIEAKKIER